MNFKSKLVSVVGAGIIALSMVGGVAADSTTADATVNVGIGGDNGGANGTLSYTITATNFGPVTTSFDRSATTTNTITLKVTDARFNRAGWTVNMKASDFTSEGKPSISANGLRIQSTNVQTVKGDSAPAPTGKTIESMSNQDQAALSVGEGSGSGQYTATYSGTLTVPANTEAGTYKTTITVNASTAPGN